LTINGLKIIFGQLSYFGKVVFCLLFKEMRAFSAHGAAEICHSLGLANTEPNYNKVFAYRFGIFVFLWRDVFVLVFF